MISSRDVDVDKTRLLLSHLSRAARKIKQKEEARGKLAEQVEKLKKVSKSRVSRKEIKELEKRLADVLQKEEEILRHQKTREMFSRRVREKIEELEKKLSRYIETKRQRERRITELEGKIRRRFAVEQREVEILEQQITGLEELFGRISGEKRYSKAQLRKVKSKIESLKKRLKKVK